MLVHVTISMILLSALTLFDLMNAPQCEIVRAAFDVGGGTTRVKVFSYNWCKEEVVGQIVRYNGRNCEERKKVPYEDDLEDHRAIRAATIEKGLAALKALKTTAKQCGAVQFSGVITPAFGQALNGNSAVIELAKRSGVSLSLLTQKAEAFINLKGAMGKLSFQSGETDGICVWSLGVSSMQMICDNEASRGIYQGQLASVSFKNLIIKDQSGDLFRQAMTPNPISRDDYSRALKVTASEAKKVFATLGGLDFFKRRTVIGVGTVHYHAVSEVLGKEQYTADEIQNAIRERLTKTDEELGGGHYVGTSVSNLILVEGMMRNLNIASVKTYRVGREDGLVASPRYWEQLRRSGF